MGDWTVVWRDLLRGYLWMLESEQAMGSQSARKCIVELDARFDYGDQPLCDPFRVLEQHADALATYSAREFAGCLRGTSDLRTIRTILFEVSFQDTFDAPLKWAYSLALELIA
jgi:hypothetical protein